MEATVSLIYRITIEASKVRESVIQELISTYCVLKSFCSYSTGVIFDKLFGVLEGDMSHASQINVRLVETNADGPTAAHFPN